MPVGKSITIEDSPSTDFDRIAVMPGVPASELSSGVVTSASTSSLESPGASVWISTRGGANSGRRRSAHP